MFGKSSMIAQLICRTYASLQSYKSQFVYGVVPNVKLYFNRRQLIGKLTVSSEV